MDKVNYRFLIIVIFLLFTSLLIGGIFFYSLFIVFALIVLLSFYMGKRAKENLVCIVWKHHQEAQVGDTIDLELQLYNSGMIPFSHLIINTNLSKKLTGENEEPTIASILSDRKLTIVKQIKCKHKGVYDVGNIEVQFSDVFGIFSWKKYFNEDITLLVYPKVPLLQYFDIPVRQHFGTITAKNKAYEDFSSTKDLRKYIAGDSLKRVNWKVSAHRNELYVKNLEVNASANVHVFLDSYFMNYVNHAEQFEEKVAECSLAILKYSLSKGMAVSLYTFTEESISIAAKGMNQFNKFLEIITRLSGTGSLPINELVRREAQKMNYDATIVVITLKVDELFVAQMNSLKMAGIYLSIIYICIDAKEKNTEFDNIRALGIKAFRVGVNDDVCLRLGVGYEN